MASDPTQPTLEEKLVLFDRNSALSRGEMKLRSHCGSNAPLKLTLVFAHTVRKWQVHAQFHPEGHPIMLLGTEDLDVFPTDELIATAMLVS
jgi:hypothetical protein